MSIKSVMPSNNLTLYCPLLLLPSIFLSIRVFSSESGFCIRGPKYWSFSISPSNEYSGLISFRIDCFDLIAVQGTLKSLPTPHIITYAKCSYIIYIHVLSSVQFSHSAMSNSLRPHELQHARPPCPSPTPGIHSDSHPSSR